MFYISGSNYLIENLLPIFDVYSLNTTKFLDYLVFKEVLTLYKQKKHLTLEGLAYIKNLLTTINQSRTDFKMPAYHKINITPYWFLGFLEAEGSFAMQKSSAKFIVCCTEVQKPVLDAIKIFLDRLELNQEYPNLYISRCSIYYRKERSLKDKPQYALTISDFYYIHHFFIPFLDNLNFLNKKKLDFKD